MSEYVASSSASSLVSLVFEEVFFGGSASLHDLFLHVHLVVLSQPHAVFPGMGC